VPDSADIDNYISNVVYCPIYRQFNDRTDPSAGLSITLIWKVTWRLES